MSSKVQKNNLKVRKLNIEIKIRKVFKNADLSKVFVYNEQVTCTTKKFEICKIEGNNRRTSQNTQPIKESPGTFNSPFLATVNQIQLALDSIVLVDALESIAVLKKRCAALGIKVNFGYWETDYGEVDENPCGQYEVERILDHSLQKHLYLIKWRGYGMELNTWEPIDHLSGILDRVQNFRLMELTLTDSNKSAYKKLILLTCLLAELVSPENDDPYALLKLNGKSASNYKPGDLIKLKCQLKSNSARLQLSLKKDEKKFQLDYDRILEETIKRLRIVVGFGSIEKLGETMKRRKKYFKCLKNREADINRLILQEEGSSAVIAIENNCDFELPAGDFTYITKCQVGPDVTITHEPTWFCYCAGGCSSRIPCCTKVNGSVLSYNKHGRLKNLNQTTIFECNSKCQCPSTCSNRVIQHGQKFKLGIFKTDNGRGWGVKALERISKGQFIVEYVGEIITDMEAVKRSKFGENPCDKSYLFDLEYEIGMTCDYVVDGGKFGNISRFINHSCAPNMEVYVFWVDNTDIKMPRIAFFSQKSIACGDELTFDYRMSAPGTKTTVKVPCKCESVNCRKFLF